jgi:hypothetical protein
MRKVGNARLIFSAGVFLSLAACSSGIAHKERPATVPQSVAPVLGWRLPKTLLDVTVTYVPTGCSSVNGVGKVDVDATVAVVGRAVADPDLGGEFPGGLVKIVPGDLTSFWVDTNVGYKVYPDRGGLLQSLSSHPVNQVGTIAGNILTGVVKIAGAVMGVPPAAAHDPTAPAGCGKIVSTLREIAAIKARIPQRTGEQATDDGLRIQNLKDSISVVMKRTFDTAADQPNANGEVGSILPDLEKVRKAGWYSGAPRQEEEHRVKIALDFSKATLLSACAKQTPVCDHSKQALPKNALFRQAAYVPVVARRGTEEIGERKVIAFGQYGEPRTLPLKAKAFRDIAWQVDFADTGEVTAATFANKAAGVGASSIFAGAATAAGGIQALAAKAPGVVDSDTLRMQAENAALKAEVENIEYKAKLEVLKAATPQP